MPRLSVDIDLDFCKPVSREEMLEYRKKINEDLVTFLQTQGYSLNLEKGKNPHSLDSWVFWYINSAGNKDNIKVEINYSMRAHILPMVGSGKEYGTTFDLTGIDSLNWSRIKQTLLPMLRCSECFDLDVSKKRVKSFLNELLKPDSKEKEFLQRFKDKEYFPELLFDDTDIVNRIKNHPMALWKIREKGDKK